MRQELIPGVEFDFGGGRVYTIPPLSLGALQRLQGKLTDLQHRAALDPVALSVVIEALHAALSRNYPDISTDAVAELIDVSQIGDVMTAVLDVSGLQRKAQEDSKNQAAQPVQTSVPTGLDSSLESA
jgi:hypothetical protein